MNNWNKIKILLKSIQCSESILYKITKYSKIRAHETREYACGIIFNL